MAEITLGNLYEFNKQAMNNEKPLDPIEFATSVKKMVEDIYKKNSYWMLLNNERRDYTVFHMLSQDGINAEMIPTLQNRGQVLSIDKQEDGNYEIWIRDIATQENFVYYLFDYNFGLIEA